MIGVLVRLYGLFFMTGLFAVGGGMATLPFLKDIGETTGWYTYADLMDMLAVSESTPGPIGINMATYVGSRVAGVPGALCATLGEVTPSILVILLVAAFLESFRESPWVERAFYGLRPASTGLIAAACAGVALEVLTTVRLEDDGLLVRAVVGEGGPLRWPQILLALILLALARAVPKVRDLHPIFYIALAAVVGIVFHFSGT